jgi:hypothetical protein
MPSRKPSLNPKAAAKRGAASAVARRSVACDARDDDDDASAQQTANPTAAPSECAAPPQAGKRAKVICVGCGEVATADGSNWAATATDERGRIVPYQNLCRRDAEFAGIMRMSEDDVAVLAKAPKKKEVFDGQREEYFKNKADPSKRDFPLCEVIEELIHDSRLADFLAFSILPGRGPQRLKQIL